MRRNPRVRKNSIQARRSSGASLTRSNAAPSSAQCPAGTWAGAVTSCPRVLARSTGAPLANSLGAKPPSVEAA